MLQKMRDGLQKWVVWLLIIVIVVSLTFWGISYYFMGGGSGSDTLVKVGDTTITQTDLDNVYSRLKLQQPQLFQSPDAENLLKPMILNQLIDQKVLSEAAEKEGFIIGQLQLDNMIESIPAFQVDGKFSNLQLNFVLSRLFYTPQSFMDELKNTLVINQVNHGITSTEFSLSNESVNYAVLSAETRSASYVIFSLNAFAKPVSMDAVNSYYAAHQSDFMTPEKISLDYIQVTPAILSKEVNPTDADLQNAYQENIQNYITPAQFEVAHILLNIPDNASAADIAALKAKLAALKTQIQKGVSFASLAQKNSQDILSAKNGGALPWFSQGTLDSSFESIVVSLKPGQISDPVQTRYGIELIKLIAVKPQVIKPFATVRAQVLAAYRSQAMQGIVSQKSDDLANITFENATTLLPAAKMFSVPIQTTTLFDKNSQSTLNSIAADPAVIAAAWSNDVLNNGNNSGVITLKDGSLVVIRIHQHIQSTPLPLTEAAPAIQKLLSKNQAAADVQTAATSAFAMLNSGKSSLQKIAAQYHLALSLLNNVGDYTDNSDSDILDNVFNLPAPNKGQNVYGNFTRENGDVVLIELTKASIPPVASISTNARIKAKQKVQDIISQAIYQAYTKNAADLVSVKQK
jgi:peptidyl-prolyl cis-trans isomerase D